MDNDNIAIKEKLSQFILNMPVSVDIAQNTMTCVAITKDELDKTPFHDQRLTNRFAPFEVPIHNNDSIKPSSIRNLNFIYHTSFCGSTFLASVLSKIENTLSIREPSILMSLANTERMNQHMTLSQINHLVKTSIHQVTTLLRTSNDQHTSTSAAIIKPSNASNNLIPYFIKEFPHGNHLFLFTSLESFLISILKKAEQGRSFVRKLYNVFSLDKSPFVIQDFRKVNEFTDLQIACFVWYHQMHLYQSFYSSNIQVRFLNGDHLLDKPKHYLERVASYFQLNLTENDWHTINKEQALETHSKMKGRQFNANIRKKEQEQVKEKYKMELSEIFTWADRYLPKPSTPPNHLKL